MSKSKPCARRYMKMSVNKAYDTKIYDKTNAKINFLYIRELVSFFLFLDIIITFESLSVKESLNC